MKSAISPGMMQKLITLLKSGAMKTSSLVIKGLALPLRLGWPKQERIEPQIIIVGIEIFFHTPPNACDSDQLNDTFCYDSLIQEIKTAFLDRSFYLIEYLAKELHAFITTAIPHADILIEVTKHPRIAGLEGHVTFRYGEHK